MKLNPVRRVLVITLVLNLAVAIGKIAIGAATGALAITADGFHSLIDSAANIVALIASVIAQRPPDDDHPYGHGRIETIAALGIGVLLLLTAWEIITSALERLSGAGEPPDASPLAFAVLIGTLVVNLFVSRYERREGERLNSQILLADAANTGADVYVTISVLVSIVLVSLGWAWADSVIALVIVVLIGRAALDVIRRTGGVLVDTAPYSPEQLVQIAASVPSVERIARARSRGAVGAAHIDIDAVIAPATTTERSAAIAHAIRQRLHEALGDIAEIEVHFIPEADAERPPTYAQTAQAAADALGLSAHEVRVTDERDHGRVLELHVEVPPGQTLGAAHDQVTQLERDLRAQFPEVTDVITHIEPAQSPTPNGQLREAASIEANALALLERRYPSMRWHHLRVTTQGSGYALALHVAMPAHLTLERAHQIAEDAELLLRAELPRLARVTIHTEPPEG